MSPNQNKCPYSSLVKGRECDCCAWCENVDKNTLYLIGRLGYNIPLFSAINVSLAVTLVIHHH